MSEAAAHVLLTAMAAYLAPGALFVAPFVWRGVQAVDPVARQGTVGFRLVIVPGVILLWPLLAWRWARGTGHPPLEVNAHRRRARVRESA
jgi:hypothetical protein